MTADPSLYTRGKHRNGLLFHELLEIIEDENDIPRSISICPPDEPLGADTDIDSDLSDEEVEGNFIHLPSRILRSEATARYDEDTIECNNEESPTCKSFRGFFL
ncbi:hypothetical protein FQR65_LT13421 [Abscondita terminalis]|nr:hypothetical protein FQR65_LT13421 [Abscondita terminalis]